MSTIFIAYAWNFYSTYFYFFDKYLYNQSFVEVFDFQKVNK